MTELKNSTENFNSHEGRRSDVQRLVMPSDVEILQSKDRKTLAEAWCELNKWEWPSWLPEESPPPKRPRDFNYRDRRAMIMREIEKLIPNRLISRVWNSEMSDEDFDDFYAGVYEHDHNAKIRYENRLRIKHGLEE